MSAGEARCPKRRVANFKPCHRTTAIAPTKDVANEPHYRTDTHARFSHAIEIRSAGVDARFGGISL
jgi:hypothetical protein